MNGAMQDIFASRRFFMHPAHATIGIAAGTAAWQACREVGRSASEEFLQAQPRHVCLLASAGRGPERLLARLVAEQLRQNAAGDGAALSVEHLRPATLELDCCDCLVLLPGEMDLEDWQVRCIRRYARGGGGLVVLDVAGLAFPGWPGLARELTGGRYRPPRSAQPCEVMPVAAARQHPILAGVAPFCCRTGLAGVVELATDATVLLTGRGGGRTEPVAWTCQDSGRIFATTLGAGDEVCHAGFLRLVVRAVTWACEE